MYISDPSDVTTVYLQSFLSLSNHFNTTFLLAVCIVELLLAVPRYIALFLLVVYL